MTEREVSREETARLLSAGFIVVDEATLRSIMQAAVLDARIEGREEAELRHDARVLADHSGEIELERLRGQLDDAQRKVKAANVWWRRWLPRAAIIAALAGVSALGLTVYLISQAEDVLAKKSSELLLDEMLQEVTRIAVEVVADEVAISEEATDQRIGAIETRLGTLRADVRSEVRDELATFRTELLRDLRQDAKASQQPL